MREYVKLGQLVLRRDSRGETHPLQYAPGYGVVCHSLLTSNGNVALVADTVKSYLRRNGAVEGWTASLEIQGESVVDAEVLVALTAAAQRAHKSTIPFTS